MKYYLKNYRIPKALLIYVCGWLVAYFTLTGFGIVEDNFHLGIFMVFFNMVWVKMFEMLLLTSYVIKGFNFDTYQEFYIESINPTNVSVATRNIFKAKIFDNYRDASEIILKVGSLNVHGSYFHLLPKKVL